MAVGVMPSVKRLRARKKVPVLPCYTIVLHGAEAVNRGVAWVGGERLAGGGWAGADSMMDKNLVNICS